MVGAGLVELKRPQEGWQARAHGHCDVGSDVGDGEGRSDEIEAANGHSTPP